MAKTKVTGGYIADSAITSDHLHTTLDLSTKTLTIGATTVSGHLIPDTNITYDLGSSTYRFRDIYLDGTTINLGGTELKKNSDGDIEFKSGSNFKKLVISELEFDDGTNRKKFKIDSGRIKSFDSSGVSDTADKISLSSNTTNDLGEGSSNLYFTTARARSSFSASTGIAISDGAISAAAVPNSSLTNSSVTINSNSLSLGGTLTLDTDDIGEGSSNLYFTTARARGAISVSGNALSYNSSTGVLTANYEESPTFTGNVTVSGTISSGTITASDTSGSYGTAMNLTAGDNLSAGQGAKQIVMAFGSSSTVDYPHSIRTRHNSNAATGNNIEFWLWHQGTDSSSTVGTQRALVLESSTGLDLLTGGYKVGGQEVISSARNLINIGTISSGAITSSGNIVSTGEVRGTTLRIQNNSTTSKYGLSLYDSTPINPTYGIMFTGTSGSGTHGSVTADWATYFTMNNTAGRGWVFRDQTTPTNVASISNTGNATFNGTISSGSITAGNSSTAATLRAHYSDGSYMTLQGYGLEMNRTASYIRPTTDGDKLLYIGGSDDSLDWSRVYFRSNNGLYLNGTQFISSGLNLTNIGTISSGAITSTGAIQGASFSDGTISGITFIDEDSFATNSATRVPTQQSIKAYVDAQVAGVVDTAPAALNTLNELAAALGDDANFSTTTSTALGNRLRVDINNQGLTGTQQANGITNLGITATKAELNVLDGITATTTELNYTDGVTSNIQTQLNAKLPLSGGTMTGGITSTAAGNAITISSSAPQILFNDTDHDNFYIHVNTNRFYVLADRDDSGSWETPHPLELNASDNLGYAFGHRLFTEAYHPNADAWTTARTLSLTGAVTGSVSWDGSGNASIATTATADPTLTLSGDASGSATFTNLGNATLSVTVADDSHNHVISNVDGLATAFDNSYITSQNAVNLAVGWYTIATNTGDRASARFGIWDINSSDHQSVTFYAAHHFGTDSSNTLTVLDNSYFSGNPFRYIRIKDGGTYDGAALQIYIDDASNNVNAAILGDNFQSSGWVLKDWVADATDPGDLSSYGNFVERSKVDLDTIAQGGFATTGEIYAGGDTTQYRAFHDAYHPNADTLTTARTIAGTSFNGSANIDISYNNLTNKPTIPTNNNQLTNGAGYQTSSGSVAQSSYVSGSAFATTGSPSSVLEYAQSSSVTDTKLAPTGDWYNSIRMGHGNPYSYYSNTLAMQMTGTGAGQIRTQLISNNNAQGWRTVWDSSNDGSGSGLDADLLDGIGGDGYLRSNATDTFGSTSANQKIRFNCNSGQYIASGGSETRFPIEIYAPTANGGDAGLTFHINNDYAGFFGLASDWNDLAWGGWSVGASTKHRIWHSGNDGSGSGLDADLLDGYNSATAATANTVVLRDGNAHIFGNYILGSYFNASSGNSENPTIGQIWTQSTGDNYLRKSTPAHFKSQLGLFSILSGGTAANVDSYTDNGVRSISYTGFSKHLLSWNAAGSTGSVQQEFDYTPGRGWRMRTKTDNNNWQSWAYVNLSSSNQGVLTGTTWHSGNDGSGSGLDADTVDGIEGASFLRSDAADSYSDIRASGSTNTGRFISSNSWGTTHYTDNGYIQFGPANSGHAHIYTDRSNFYFNVTALYANGSTMWHAGNDGAGSGLDADLLDGYHLTGGSGSIGERVFNNQGRNHGTQTNFNDTSLRAGVNYLQGGTNGPTGTTGHQWYGFRLGLGNDYGTQTGQSGHYASELYWARQSQGGGAYLWARDMESGSWQSWRKMYAGYADSAGSATNADTVDGYHGSNYLGKNGNAYYQADNWIQFGGAYGLYVPTVNGAHLLPNTVTSYGTWRTVGSRGGYDGIMFDDGGNMACMWDGSGSGGFYQQGGAGWTQYFYAPNSCTGFGGSTTSSSYEIYVSGAIYSTGNITAYSDKRVKENIVPIDNALEKVNGLQGVYYNRIDDEDKTKEIGFIAQEVNEVVPELVTYAEDVDQYGVKYGNTTALLVEAVKELTQQVKDLKQEIEEIKNVK
jgi:hypothetical protein